MTFFGYMYFFFHDAFRSVRWSAGPVEITILSTAITNVDS